MDAIERAQGVPCGETLRDTAAGKIKTRFHVPGIAVDNRRPDAAIHVLGVRLDIIDQGKKLLC
jgi:hypothetical protein